MSFITLPNGSMIDSEQLSRDFSGMSWESEGDVLVLRLKSGSILRFRGSAAIAVMEAIGNVDVAFDESEDLQ